MRSLMIVIYEYWTEGWWDPNTCDIIYDEIAAHRSKENSKGKSLLHFKNTNDYPISLEKC